MQAVPPLDTSEERVGFRVVPYLSNRVGKGCPAFNTRSAELSNVSQGLGGSDLPIDQPFS